MNLKLSLAILSAMQLAHAGNTYPLSATIGSAELEWVSASTFRFNRTWNRHLETKPDRTSEEIVVSKTNEKGIIEFRSEHLIVRIAESTLALEVLDRREKLLLKETKAAEINNGKIQLNRQILVAEDFLGFGPRTDSRLGARGLLIDSQTPFFISTAGYAMEFTSAGKYHFDLGKTSTSDARTTIDGENRVEYFFHYGPSVKDIFEERAKWQSSVDYGEEDVNIRSAARLPKFARKMEKQPDSCRAVAALVHTSLSGTRVPAINLDDYTDENMQLLGNVIPMVYRKEWSPATGLRKQLIPFLITYLQEAKDKGYPMIHPLPMQFPDDKAGLERSDEFMLGDEILVAPLCENQTSRTVYLPRGYWTSFPSGQRFSGRQTIDVTAVPGQIPMFLKNGAVLPLGPLGDYGPTEIHYFPKLGGEFFIWEPDADFISQLHASPALDYYRVESETRKDRDYEWVLHHMEEPARVQMVDGPDFARSTSLAKMGLNQWFFNTEKKELRLRLHATVGSHEIVNIWLANTGLK